MRPNEILTNTLHVSRVPSLKESNSNNDGDDMVMVTMFMAFTRHYVNYLVAVKIKCLMWEQPV